MHQEMNSEAASSSSPLRVAVPPNRARVEEEVQTNENMQDLDRMEDVLETTKKELDEMTKTMLTIEEDRDMWRKLFEDCNKRQGEEIERSRRKSDTYKRYFSWAVPDGTLDASRNDSDYRNATPGCNWSSDNPGPE